MWPGHSTSGNETSIIIILVGLWLEKEGVALRDHYLYMSCKSLIKVICVYDTIIKQFINKSVIEKPFLNKFKYVLYIY